MLLQWGHRISIRGFPATQKLLTGARKTTYNITSLAASHSAQRASPEGTDGFRIISHCSSFSPEGIMICLRRVLTGQRPEPGSERRQVQSLLFEHCFETMPFNRLPPSRNFLNCFVVRKIEHAKKTLPLERTFKREDRLG